jgi:hypothetical protein
MKRKIIVIFLALIGLSIIGASILLFLGAFKPQEAGILVESEPTSIVYIDGKEVGKTPYEANLEPGEITIRVKPVQIEGQILDDYETKINLESGIKTIIKRTFKETEEYSSGVVVSFEKINGEDGLVTVVSVPDNAQVIIDGKVYGYTPLRIKIPAGDHNLVISAEKYLEKSLPIRVVKGYKLTASIKLAKSIVPIPTEIPVPKEKIEILDTGTGFLRVREKPGLNFPEVTQVKTGEIYEILETDETGKWYKININNIEGWILGEFTKKILDSSN